MSNILHKVAMSDWEIEINWYANLAIYFTLNDIVPGSADTIIFLDKQYVGKRNTTEFNRFIKNNGNLFLEWFENNGEKLMHSLSVKWNNASLNSVLFNINKFLGEKKNG